MQHTSIDVCPYAFLPVRIVERRGQGEVRWPNAALAGLLHHVAPHVAGSTGTDAERSNNDALLGHALRRSEECRERSSRNAASNLRTGRHKSSVAAAANGGIDQAGAMDRSGRSMTAHQ